jgi:hypothetical protein
MKERLFQPLYLLKKDAKLFLYSLQAWNFYKNIGSILSSTRLGEAINRINTMAIECIYSSSFFQYCTEVSEGKELYAYMSEALPRKKWLFDLSANQRIKGTTVSDFFEQRPTFFDCVKDMDISRAYSLMQYFEGYYLIRESVKRGLIEKKSTIQVGFVLPNDESKYYADLPNDIEKMLHSDFGKKLTGLVIKVTFVFFQYGESVMSRPYIDKRSKAPRVTPNEINAYFDYISQSIG